MKYCCHYDYLEENLESFFLKIGIKPERFNKGIIVAHGDKCYGYEDTWEKAGLHFYHGVAIYLLTYLRPFCDEVRETKQGWVDVSKWIIENKDRFLPFLNPVED
jgi:hypothetical protein